MRVLVWATFFPPYIGGYTKNILELSRRLVERGYQVDVVTCRTNNSPATEIIDGVGVKRVPSLLLLNKLYPVPLPSKMLLSILVKRDYDITITQTRFFILSFIGAVFSALYRIPLIHVERGSYHPVVISPVISFISKMYDHTIGYWIMRKAKQVIGVSEVACEFAQHLGARDIIRIPNGVIDPIWQSGRGEHSPANVLYVGRLVQAKGVQDLIIAITRLNGRCRLTVVGDGPYRKQLQELAEGSNVCFLGELTGRQLSSTYQHADVFCNPSYSEGLPTSVMEATVYGVPVVATNVGGTGEIIQTMVTGLLVESRDVDGIEGAISWILDHKEEARGMAEVCKKRILELFSWNIITNQYCELLEDLRGTNNV